MAWLLEGPRRPPLKHIWTGIVGGGLLSLLGLAPALLLSSEAGDQVFHEANRIYVFWRLDHHLDPASFRSTRLVNSLLCAAFVAGAFFGFRHFQWQRRLGYLVFGAVAIGLLGYTLRFALESRPALMAAALRFYWFRLPDVLVPAGAALFLVTIASTWRRVRLVTVATATAALGVAVWLSLLAYQRFGQPPRAEEADVAAYRDWLNLCRYVRESTPPDARVLTPLHARTFHWHAQREEVVSWKNIPQDAASIVRWAERIRDIYYIDGVHVPLCDQDTDEVRGIAQDYEAHYIVSYPTPLLALPRLYSNRSYALYRVPNDAK
jgi:hypothetical protein